jgi:hypothetical protein
VAGARASAEATGCAGQRPGRCGSLPTTAGAPPRGSLRPRIIRRAHPTVAQPPVPVGGRSVLNGAA